MGNLFTKTDLQDSLKSFSGTTVGIIGDIMLDCFIYGTVDRISPEAPVPIVEVTNESLALGGAANVANNVVSLGGKPIFISVSGQDSTALQIEQLLKSSHISYHLIKDPTRPSTLKTRVIGQHQQIVRFDREMTAPFSDSVRQQCFHAIEQNMSHCDCIILSDYAKGMIDPDFMAALRSFCKNKQVKLLVDPKPANIDLFKKSFLLTPNAKEAGQAVGMGTPKTQQEIIRVGKAVLNKYPTDNLLITLGAQGMALFCSNGQILHIPTMAQNVFDVTGAGDTVVGTLGLGLAAGSSLLASCVLANYAAGLVTGKLGTACVTPDEMASELLKSPLPSISEWNNGD